MSCYWTTVIKGEILALLCQVVSGSAFNECGLKIETQPYHLRFVMGMAYGSHTCKYCVGRMWSEAARENIVRAKISDRKWP